MTDSALPPIRIATPRDAGPIAALHADSWRRHYRGAYADSYLDGDLDTERRAVWSERLESPTMAVTLVTYDGAQLIGFVHTILEADPLWGSLVENLHVSHDRHRSGIGRRLMAASAHEVISRSKARPMHLWVLEQNTRAQSFYCAIGGRCAETGPCPPPGGVPARLDGQPRRHRFAWSDAALLTR